jgi:hypothetical protein
MATKKQKREAALAKRERFLETQKRLGLEALRLAREARKARGAAIDEEIRERICANSRRVAVALLRADANN